MDCNTEDSSLALLAWRLKMLSRLSGLANTVLHELSGDGEDGGTEAPPAGPEMEPGLQNGEEAAAAEDVLDRLAHTERLVAQLKDLVREKDAQLQQKEAQLQEERQAAEAKLLKLKLQAKAKLASLNKRIEELAERGGGGPPGEPPSPAQVDSEQRPQGRPEEEATTEEVLQLRRQLQAQEETMGKLQQQLEAATESLDQAQAQLMVLREEIQEKESQLEEQARRHQSELQHLMAASAAEGEMQQNLRRLQQKLEEQEAALLGRTQVVELLQQELDAFEQQNKAVVEKSQTAEAEVESLRSTLASERQASQSRAEKLELELAEQKLASHRLQEQVQQLSRALAEATATRAELERESQAAAQRHAEEEAQKGQEIADLQRAEQDLRDENAQLRQEAGRPREPSTGGASLQQGDPPEKPQRPGQSQAETDPQGAGQLIPLEGKPGSEQSAAAAPLSLQGGGGDQEDRAQEAARKGADAGTETSPRGPALLEETLGFTEGTAEPNQVGGAEAATEEPPRLPSGPPSALVEHQGSRDSGGSEREEGPLSSEAPAQPSPLESPRGASPSADSSPTDILAHLSEKRHKDLSALLLELQEAQEEVAFLKGQLPGGSHDSGGGGEGLEAADGGEDAPSLAGTLLQPGGPSAKDHGEAQGSEPQAGQQEAEELRQGALEEREAEIRRLQQLLEEAGGAADALRVERDRLLSRLEEPGALAELKAQVQRLEAALAEAEARRLAEYEGGLSQLGRWKEEAQSLSNEARSKEVKIAALQKDLDEGQRRLAEQGERLQQAEQERTLLAGRLQEARAEADGLSQSLAAKEQEAARLERLLAESAGQLERLRQGAAEREERAAEVARGLLDRMAQLSEEKQLLGKELQSLTERLSLSLQEKTTRDQGVGTEAAEEVAEEEAEHLRKENEQAKKLQAALASRKELLARVRRLERGPPAGQEEEEEPGKPLAKGLQAHEEEGEEAGEEEPAEGRKDSDAEPRPAGQGQEAELQAAPGERESTMVALQAAVAELRQSLQEKDLRIGALQAELEGRTSVDQSDPAGPGLQAQQSGPVGPPAPEEEPPGAGPHERISALEQEKEQLQKRLQEALASRKDTLKKAQEKDRHHREQLRQHKEQLELQLREKESLQEQLQALSQSPGAPAPAEPPEEAPSEGAPEADVLQGPGREVSAAGALPGGPLPTAEGLPAEQPKADLERLQDEKRELEAQVGRLEGELASRSAAVLQLQARSAELLAELERAQGACSEAEAAAAGLRVALEQSRAEASSLEDLGLRQAALEEGKAAASKAEVESLNAQLKDKCDAVNALQVQLQEREDVVRALQGQLEVQRSEQAQQRLRVEAAEAAQQKAADEGPSKAQLQRKLQAALLSRKEALKESKGLREELAGAKAALQGATARLSEAEGQASRLGEEKAELLQRMALLAEERNKLVAEVDRALVENQSLSGACESLKLVLEEVTAEKARREEQAGAERRAHGQELAEEQRKHRELQAEYETLLRSYENVSGEAERMQRVAEAARQEAQGLFLRLKEAQAERAEGEARLQAAEQEVEGMREKMRKFAKSKQQKILELEEENERLRASEALPAGEGPRRREEEEADARLVEELADARRSCEDLSARLEALLAEKEGLQLQVQEWRQRSQGQAERAREHGLQEERVVAKEAVTTTAACATPEEAEVRPEPAPEPPEATAGQEGGLSCNELDGYVRQVADLSEQVAELEEKRKAAAEELARALEDLGAVRGEKGALEELLAGRGQQLEQLQEKVSSMEEAGRQAEEQLAGARRLQEALAAEKDDLEERLMDQLAQLNGSIGNYQQEVADLQGRNRELRREAEGLRGVLGSLQEETRQLLREKAEAEAERTEQEARQKSGWKGDGSSRRAQVEELRELLREKQQEVRQLQRDCIRSQERASGLERSVKALEFVQSEARKELEAAKEGAAKAGEEAQRARAELASCRARLDDTQSEAARALAEGQQAKEELRAGRAELGAQLGAKEQELRLELEQEQGRQLQERRALEERLQASRREQARAEGALRELQESLRQKDQQAQQLQGSLNHTLAQLAAFSKSMSSLQDDRDRVVDQARQWERKFAEAIEKKEREVQAREQACAALETRVRQGAAQVEDLQSLLASLEQDKAAQESSAQKQLQRHQEEARGLRAENEGLASQLEEARRSLGQSQEQRQRQEAELGALREQLARLQGSFARCQEAQGDLEARLRGQEADLREGRFRREQLEANLRATKELTERLQEEAAAKDQKILRLLAAQEEALAAAASELQQKHRQERKSLEDGMARAEAEKADALEKADLLAEKLEAAREESGQLQAQLGSFAKSMSSLQDDRDRVLADYRQLEQRHLAAVPEKDRLIQEAAAENNALKEELRGLHARLDDLHAENAKLEAELVRYRQDLHRLIAIKDCQQKELLAAELERVRALEEEKAAAEDQLRDLRQEKHGLEQEARALQASLARAEEEKETLGQGGALLELQARLRGKEEEALALSGQLSRAHQRARGLEEELASLRSAAAQRVQEAEAKMEKELRSLHHDAGLMRNETETAEERVAELAKDLLEMEQSLLAVTEENQDLKAQLQSFQKAMGSLQDSWDQAHEELRALQKRSSEDLEEQRRLVQSLSKEKVLLQEEQKLLSEERDALASDLAALRSSVEEKGLLARLDLLGRQLGAKEEELLRLTSELEAASGQVSSFSKALASLQGERDRLLGELDRARKEEALRLQSAAGASASLAEVPGLKRALSALQDDRDRLLVELKNLQQQYLQAGVDTAEMARLKAQLQERQQEAERLQEAGASLQSELQQLREEKAAWETEATTLKGAQQEGSLQKTKRPSETFLEKDQLRSQPASGSAGSSKPAEGGVPSPGADAEGLQAQLRSTLSELHQKELRVQQLNSKLSQVFEEKNALALQLRGSSCSLRESHQRFSEVLARCQALEKRLQADQAPPRKGRESSPVDAAPGAPQERSEPPRESYTPELQELQMKLSAAKEQQSQAREGLLQLEELLQEERDRRLAAEEAFSSARDHIRRLESSEWSLSAETSIDIPDTPEHRLLGGPSETSFSKARGGLGPRRVLRSLFCSRRRLPWLATGYLLAVHVLLLLCFTGHL